MKLRTVPAGALAVALSCVPPGAQTPTTGAARPSNCDYDDCPADPPPAPAPTAAQAAPGRAPGSAAAPAATVRRGPVFERAQLLRQAADQLDRAQAALDNGDRSVAERLFSTAELLVGPELLAPIAPKFRDGAAPRITAPAPATAAAAPAAPGQAPGSATAASGAAPVRRGPVSERTQLLREAADQLDRAQIALDNGNRNVAERLFSTAELLVGPELLASIAPKFREGAPPRITTPPKKVDPAAPPQPRVRGNSEAEDDEARVPQPRVVSSLTGTVQIDGRPVIGTFGLVTLEPTEGPWKPRTPKHVVLEQRNREFLPHVMAVSVGTTVAFPNFDPVFHNVFTTSPINPFDLGLYKAGEAREYTFQSEGIIRLSCNLHANMSAYIAIVSAPAYVVTDDAGHFAFRRLAPGKYKLKAWSERSRAPITQDIVIKPGKNEVTVGVAGDAAAGPQPDKFGGKRG